MEIITNGGLREKNGKFILTIYSTPFARYLLYNKIAKVNLTFDKDTAIICGGENKRLSIERKRENHPLIATYVSKILPINLKEKVKSNNGQLPIRILIRDFITEKELLDYNHQINRAEPKNYEINTPKSDLLKVGCFISCFRQNNKIWYRFNARHRIFEHIVKNNFKVDICRIEDEFFIKRNHNGNELHLYKNKEGHSLAYMQISSEFLKNNEKKLFEEGRRAISFKAFLCCKEFELNVSELFYNKEEKELARELMKNNIEIQMPEMRKREADIILPKSNAQIEITKISPVKIEKYKNNAHGEGIHINARLCEGFVRVMNNKIDKFFVIIHKDWMGCQWVNDIYDMIKPKVIVIPTNFKNDWAVEVTNKIKLALKK